MKKTIYAYSLLTTLAFGLLAVTSCRSIKNQNNPNNNEYMGITESDLITYVQARYKPSQIIFLAHTQQKRKQIIDHVKKTFAVAQAAHADDLEKGEDFNQRLALNTARFLAFEYSKRNENFEVSKADIDWYLDERLNEFETDFALISMDGKQTQTTQTIDRQKAQWAELHLRAEKGRQIGIEKEEAFQQIVRLLRADILANIYLKKIKEQHKTTEADIKDYYAQHPEADPEKIKHRMADLLTRLNKGEGFEKIADEINEDGTKGKGGDLGWFGEGVMAPELEKAAFALQPGQIGQELVKTNYGYHLIKVEGRRKAAAAIPPGNNNNKLKRASDSGVTDPKASEEIHARHIYLSVKTGEEAISRLTQKKINRVIEEIKRKYPVNAPEDFKIKVEGLNPTKNPPAPITGKVGR